MASDSHLFRTDTQLHNLGCDFIAPNWKCQEALYRPLYEAKMVHIFNSRFGTYEGQTEAQHNKGVLPRSTPKDLSDPAYIALPQYWVDDAHIQPRVPSDERWLIGWRRATRSVDERTLIPALLPRTAVGHSLQMIYLPLPPSQRLTLYANLSSYAADYVARMKHAGSDFGYFVLKQLFVVPREHVEGLAPWAPLVPLHQFIASRSLELSYVGYDLIELGDDFEVRSPFRWSDERRRYLRAELDACFFHLYGIERDDVDYIMETFPIVKRKDEAEFGEYRTKRLILERFDAMAEAEAAGREYETILDPPPADPSLCHPESTRPDWAKPRSDR